MKKLLGLFALCLLPYLSYAKCSTLTLEKFYLQKKQNVRIELCERKFQNKTYLVTKGCLQECSLLEDVKKITGKMPFSRSASPQGLLCEKLNGEYRRYTIPRQKKKLSMCLRGKDAVESHVLYLVKASQ
jgi:hypothetical protein